jgi:hypothetical protein
MDERTLAQKPGFQMLAGDLKEAFRAVMAGIGDDLIPRRIAAE